MYFAHIACYRSIDGFQFNIQLSRFNIPLREGVREMMVFDQRDIICGGL